MRTVRSVPQHELRPSSERIMHRSFDAQFLGLLTGRYISRLRIHFAVFRRQGYGGGGSSSLAIVFPVRAKACTVSENFYFGRFQQNIFFRYRKTGRFVFQASSLIFTTIYANIVIGTSKTRENSRAIREENADEQLGFGSERYALSPFVRPVRPRGTACER